MKNLMSNGNRKCKNMLIFNLPAVKSCPEHKDCSKDCYALKAERMYKTAKARRENNFKLAKKDLNGLSLQLREQLNKTKLTVCRIHESGDYFNQEYLDMWVNIARDYPSTKFFGFTKTRRIHDFSVADSLPNINILDSYIYGKYLNFGNKEYVYNLAGKDPNIYICPGSAAPNAIHCNDPCRYCIDGGKLHIGIKH